jgi:hypothetical protein
MGKIIVYQRVVGRWPQGAPEMMLVGQIPAGVILVGGPPGSASPTYI